ncbi:MAG TPA: SCO family protein [Verrucomicrobiae bacterium]|nr:SCO family protein [Verrucomicrobiae bacterium]
MKHRLFLVLTVMVLSVFHLCQSVAQNGLTDAQLLQIKYDQKPGSQVSPNLAFRDETGKQVRLADYFGKRPIVLVPGYYRCPMLCSLVMEGLIESFRDLRWSAGKQFDVIFVSIDPREGPALADAKKKVYLRDYGRAGTQNGWHFLVAVNSSISEISSNNSHIEPSNLRNPSSLPTFGRQFPLSQPVLRSTTLHVSLRSTRIARSRRQVRNGDTAEGGRERAGPSAVATQPQRLTHHAREPTFPGASFVALAKAEVRESLSDDNAIPGGSPPHDSATQTLADEIGFRFAYDPGTDQFAHPAGFVVLTPGGKVAHYFFGVTFSAKELDLALRRAILQKTDSPVRDFILLCCEYSPLRGKYGNLVMDVVRAGGLGMVAALGIYFIRPIRRKSIG